MLTRIIVRWRELRCEITLDWVPGDLTSVVSTHARGTIDPDLE
jgi:hypothetical protein